MTTLEGKESDYLRRGWGIKHFFFQEVSQLFRGEIVQGTAIF